MGTPAPPSVSAIKVVSPQVFNNSSSHPLPLPTPPTCDTGHTDIAAAASIFRAMDTFAICLFLRTSRRPLLPQTYLGRNCTTISTREMDETGLRS